MTQEVFVIGDVHGHLDRLEALLKQEGFLVWCDTCQGGGQLVAGKHKAENVFGWDYDYKNCEDCKGLGQKRDRTDVMIVQLGDLGQFGAKDSPTGDLLCYKYVYENRWADVVLWGNHDRAQVDENHAFTGFLRNYEALHYIKMLHRDGRLMMALAAHDFLITHAGLASAFEHQNVDDKLKRDPQAFADWINDEDERYLSGADVEHLDVQATATRDAISARRGGRSPVGGILWRDIEEKLYVGFRQIFGHSADRKEAKVRYCWENGNTRDPSILIGGPHSYCIDVGGKDDSGRGACLAGIWLPNERVIRVDMG